MESNRTHVIVRKNKAEESWEVIIDFGRFGKLFSNQAEAESFANEMESTRFGLESRFGLVERLSMRRLDCPKCGVTICSGVTHLCGIKPKVM